jgi:hypothetical protein
MIFDYNRSKRHTRGDSPIEMMKEYAVADELKKRVTISFNK